MSKDISNDLREAIVATHQSVMGYKAISTPFGVHHSTERKIIHERKPFNQLPTFRGVDVPENSRSRLNCTQRSCKKEQNSTIASP